MTESAVDRRFRNQIPAEHRGSLDTRIQWLWMQRFGTAQSVWANSPDMLDKTAATIFLQAIMGADLNSITTLFQRLEGGPLADTKVRDRASELKI